VSQNTDGEGGSINRNIGQRANLRTTKCAFI